jgi:integrase
MVYESTHLSNKREAAQIEAAHKTRLAKGAVGIQERKAAPTLKAFASRFEQAIEMQCAPKPATITFYKNRMKSLLANDSLAGARLDTIDEAAIEAYKQTRSRTNSRRGCVLSPACINSELATLRRLLRLAQEWKVIDRVPRIRLLRGEHNREFVLNSQQETLYLATVSPTLHDVALMLLDTGLRVGEALKMEWPEVRFEPAEGAQYGYLTVRSGNAKNSKARNVPLSDRVRAMLERLGPAKAGLVYAMRTATSAPNVARP